MPVYRTPAAPHIIEFEEKRSRFVAHLAHFNSDSEFKAFLAQIREDHPKASHHCWAHILRMPNDAKGWNQSDDGEPKGTAGKPMLNILSHADVGECGVVIARYFGGTKLGTGGLVRAYSAATKQVLEEASWSPLEAKKILEIVSDYQEINHVQRWMQSHHIQPLNQIFDEKAQITLQITESQFDELVSIVEDLRHTAVKNA
ncbi:YigZ family protein [Litoribacillus peritrichatus]|uniref:YigZ family protein n=1 Tax=Litoribacillus peritrichatus TaxID=718191 RepID=A0ABP7N8R6_9GAMM